MRKQREIAEKLTEVLAELFAVGPDGIDKINKPGISIGPCAIERKARAMTNRKSWRAFLDWFILFSGISTASNLSRTRKTPVVGRGMFLFRTPERPKTPRVPQ